MSKDYQYLERRRGSNYAQLYVKGRGIRAEVLYRHSVGSEPRTPEEVARDFELPVEAVREAIDYCLQNEPLLREEREREQTWFRQQGLDKPPLVPPGFDADA
jgi:uncharacterized protein (DUF433 family)